MMTRLISALLLLAIGLLIYGREIGSAQSNTASIAYGDTVTGEITDGAYEWRYTFTGSAGDIVAVEMRSQDRSLLNPLLAPNLRLRDPNNELLVDTAPLYPVDDTTLVAELPVSGDYLLVATRESGAQGGSRGAFTLSLIQVPMLSAGESVPGTINPSDSAAYYAFKPSEPFSVVYSRQSGDYAPRVSVNRMDAETGALLPLAYAGGVDLTVSCLGSFALSHSVVIALTADEYAFTLEATHMNYDLLAIYAECATSS